MCACEYIEARERWGVKIIYTYMNAAKVEQNQRAYCRRRQFSGTMKKRNLLNRIVICKANDISVSTYFDDSDNTDICKWERKKQFNFENILQVNHSKMNRFESNRFVEFVEL